MKDGGDDNDEMKTRTTVGGYTRVEIDLGRSKMVLLVRRRIWTSTNECPLTVLSSSRTRKVPREVGKTEVRG